MEAVKKTIGERIRIARKEAKITQKTLASMTNIAEITIRQYEADKYTPKSEALHKIAKALLLPSYYFDSEFYISPDKARQYDRTNDGHQGTLALIREAYGDELLDEYEMEDGSHFTLVHPENGNDFRLYDDDFFTIHRLLVNVVPAFVDSIRAMRDEEEYDRFREMREHETSFCQEVDDYLRTHESVTEKDLLQEFTDPERFKDLSFNRKYTLLQKIFERHGA